MKASHDNTVNMVVAIGLTVTVFVLSIGIVACAYTNRTVSESLNNIAIAIGSGLIGFLSKTSPSGASVDAPAADTVNVTNALPKEEEKP